MGVCHCVFPGPGEEELATVPGEEPGTAVRVFVNGGPDGYARVQQMAFTDGVGWYVQKTMVLPRDVLAALLPQLRKALCLMPPPARPQDQSRQFPRLSPAPEATQSDRPATGTTGLALRLAP